MGVLKSRDSIQIGCFLERSKCSAISGVDITMQAHTIVNQLQVEGFKGSK